MGKHNYVFKNTFYGYHRGCEEKEMERYVFIHTLAVSAYFALVINVPVVVKELINDINCLYKQF